MDVAAVIISGLALIVAVAALVSQHRRDKVQQQHVEQEVAFGDQQVGLQERVTAIEEARWQEEVDRRLTAKVSARFVLESHTMFATSKRPQTIRLPAFVVTNDGPAVAEDVGVDIRAAHGEGSLPRLDINARRPLPAPVLHPGETFRADVEWEDRVAPYVVIDLWWKDGRGRQDVMSTLRTY